MHIYDAVYWVPKKSQRAVAVMYSDGDVYYVPSRFLVVDGAMNDVIRPSLYGAYHHVSPACSHPRSAGNSIGSLLSLDHQAEPPPRTHHCVLDVVGPVCESGDFLAKASGASK